MGIPGKPGDPKPEPTSGPDRTDAPAKSCPFDCELDGRWVDDEAYCGDKVRIEAQITPPPADGPAEIQIWLFQKGSAPASKVAFPVTVRGGRIDADWVVKALSAQWRTDTLRFSVLVSGVAVHGFSRNELAFKARPVTGWLPVQSNLPTPPPKPDPSKPGGVQHFAPPCEAHDARLHHGFVHLRLKLRTFGLPLLPPRQAAIKQEIELLWNSNFDAFLFHRRHCARRNSCDCAFDCCKVNYHLDVEFVASGEHIAVEIKPGTGRAAMGRYNSKWYDVPQDAGSVYAHEVGHVLGQYDEYPSGATDPTGVQPASAPQPNLMSIGEGADWRGSTRLFRRHYRWVERFLNQNSHGDPYETITK